MVFDLIIALAFICIALFYLTFATKADSSKRLQINNDNINANFLANQEE